MSDYLFNEKRTILSQIRSMNRKVVIFGDGVASEAIFLVCTDAGLSPNAFVSIIRIRMASYYLEMIWAHIKDIYFVML